MKTILTSSCYLDGKDGQGNERFERTRRYVEYYLSNREHFGIEKIALVDNGSKDFIFPVCDFVDFISLPNLEHHRPGKQYDYPNCWRSLYYMQEFIKQGYKKIIVIDTDTFVVSKKCAEYIKNLTSGFTTFWCRRWGFPAAEGAVLCEDKFDRFLEYCKTPWEERLGTLFETSVPYTQINIEYNCDRYGEIKAPLTPEIDIYGQAGPEIIPQLL